MPTLDELRMPSLSTEELIESVKKGDKGRNEPDPRDSEEYTFYFEYVNKRGEVFEGRFTNRILTLEQTQQVHVLKARMLQSVSMTAVSDEILATSQVLAHMSISLDHKVEWAKDLRALRDPGVIWKLWAKVEDHESRYFRMDENSESSKGA
jgi:hypothetical protein